MNSSMTRHPFALPAIVLSILITSTMALLPAVAGIGANHSARALQTAQATTAQSHHVISVG